MSNIIRTSLVPRLQYSGVNKTKYLSEFSLTHYLEYLINIIGYGKKRTRGFELI